MPRATSVQPAADRKGGDIVDTLILPFAQRQVQQGFLFGMKGTCVEMDLAEPVRLRTDDALVLEDGKLVEVVAEAEPLIEVRTADLPSLARMAWYLGNLHVPVQIFERRLRLARNPEVEALLETFGAKVAAIEAPFEPEGGAYAAPGGDPGHHHHDHDHGHHHHHDHHHDHDHDHSHGHHDHAHKHDHGKS